ncbi:MAG: hypothetical protein WBG73_09815 [Coleofasciculaceae cyanobacterium]
MLAHSVDINNAVWYLGIDFGTTGVSAVLLNKATAQRYPLFWSNELHISQEQLQTVNPQLSIRNSAAIFRLPAITYSGEAASKLFVKFPVTPIIVGSLAAKLASEKSGIFLENFKPYLNIGVPYYCPDQQQWQPQIKLPNQQLVSLYWVRRTLQAMLGTISPKSTLADAVMKVGAVGLTPETLALALGKLQGVICGYPASWGDTYQLNLREAVLDAKLVKHPEQVFFVEDAIAISLAILPSVALNNPETIEEFSFLAASQCRGGMLVIKAGMTTTEMALVDFPDDLKKLTHDDFSVLSLAYGSDALAQDIFCQLLYPQLSETQLQQISLTSEFELPQPGQLDQQKRDRLSLLLLDSAFGKALLKASGYLLTILQHKEEFTLELGHNRWLVKAADLETLVILPFVQQLNQGLLRLMVETGLTEAKITQFVGVGGTVLETIEKWISTRLPHAIFVQKAIKKSAKVEPENLILNSLIKSGLVATGLATLPLYPQVLHRSQHQYNDYFLLLELIRASWQLPQASNSYSLEEIMQQLERRGLNTSACYDRLVDLVNGQLPAGLVPSPEQDSRIVASQTSLFDELTTAPLFSQEGDHYCLNLQQRQRLADYLDMLVSTITQKFAEPLFVKWAE